MFVAHNTVAAKHRAAERKRILALETALVEAEKKIERQAQAIRDGINERMRLQQQLRNAGIAQLVEQLPCKQ